MRTEKAGFIKLLEFIGRPIFWILQAFVIGILLLSSIINQLGWLLIHLCQFIGRLIINALHHCYQLLHRLPKSLTPLLSTIVNFCLRLPSLRPPTEKTHRVFPPRFPHLRPLPQLRLSLPSISLPRPTLPRIKIKFPSYPSLRASLAPALKILIFIISFSLSLFYFAIIKDLPSPKNLTDRDQVVSTKIYDRHGILLYKIYKNQNRSLINLSDLPKYLIEATIAIEDQNFYQHAGVSFKGVARAVKRNFFENKTQGGSTITQQLVKNALLTNEKTLTRKVKELVLSIGVELNYSKNDILQMYFNEVGYGGAAYGIEEASQLYFGKSAHDVNLAEAALLAGLPAAPTTYSPFGAHPELATTRQHQVLRRMVEDNYITPEEAEAAKAFPLAFSSNSIDIKAPHFVMYVKDLLVKQFGETMVHQGGLEVVTSLDLNIQQAAETIIKKELDKLASLHITNASALVTHPKTGEILAMVGSKDYFDFEHDGQVNVTLRPRQPGSAIKPITYAVALENGYTPSTIIDDSPIVYRTPGSPPYAPQNYDGQFHGRVTLRRALASSYNVPAVKTLSQFGVSKLIDKAQSMGITTWNNPSRFGLSLTLGGGEVKMVDFAVAYGTLANLGMRVDLNPFLKISDYKGKTFELASCPTHPSLATVTQAADHFSCQNEPVVDPLVAYQLCDILSDNSARAPAFGTYSVLNIPNHQVAVKTGTTNNLRDNWTIGFTENYLVAAWVGNNDNSSMSYVASGITGASPIWSQIITHLLKDSPPQQFSPPSNLTQVTICQLTNTLSCPSCPNPKVEYFVPGTEPKSTCTHESINSILNPPSPEPLPRDQILQGSSTSN